MAVGRCHDDGHGLHHRLFPGGRCRQRNSGDGGTKVVISDRLKSYLWIRRRQFCWAHLRRNSGDDRSWGRSRRGGSAVVGTLRSFVRVVAPGPGRDHDSVHFPVLRGNHALLGAGRSPTRGGVAAARRRGRAGNCRLGRHISGPSCESRGSSRPTTRLSGRYDTQCCIARPAEEPIVSRGVGL